MRQRREQDVRSFAGLAVEKDTLRGGDQVLPLYDVTALVGRAAVFPRHLRPALRAYGSEADDQIYLVVTTPSGDTILRCVGPGLEVEARAFAARLNGESAGLRKD